MIMNNLLHCKTICEYVKADGPFYHISPQKNKDSILRNGILAGPHGICVVRSDDKEVIHTIAMSQLSGDGIFDFILIKLTPSKHKFGAKDIKPDSVRELTAPLQNYIHKRKISIEEIDIVSFFRAENTNSPSQDKIISLDYNCVD